ncbi:MAG: aldehyde dehydrogenase family protein [Nitrospira sp.]|nr:aldehyde dehydrogenase family protein [Nitrospira sp.]
MLINGHWTEIPKDMAGFSLMEVIAPYDRRLIGHIPEAGYEDVDNAISAADSAFRKNQLTTDERFKILSKTSRLLDERKRQSPVHLH